MLYQSPRFRGRNMPRSRCCLGHVPDIGRRFSSAATESCNRTQGVGNARRPTCGRCPSHYLCPGLTCLALSGQGKALKISRPPWAGRGARGALEDHSPKAKAPYLTNLKSAMNSWLLCDSVRVLVHINLLPSGEKTGRTSAPEKSVTRSTSFPLNLPSTTS